MEFQLNDNELLVAAIDSKPVTAGREVLILTGLDEASKVRL